MKSFNSGIHQKNDHIPLATHLQRILWYMNLGERSTSTKILRFSRNKFLKGINLNYSGNYRRSSSYLPLAIWWNFDGGKHCPYLRFYFHLRGWSFSKLEWRHKRLRTFMISTLQREGELRHAEKSITSSGGRTPCGWGSTRRMSKAADDIFVRNPNARIGRYKYSPASPKRDRNESDDGCATTTPSHKYPSFLRQFDRHLENCKVVCPSTEGMRVKVIWPISQRGRGWGGTLSTLVRHWRTDSTSVEWGFNWTQLGEVYLKSVCCRKSVCYWRSAIKAVKQEHAISSYAAYMFVLNVFIFLRYKLRDYVVIENCVCCLQGCSRSKNHCSSQ